MCNFLFIFVRCNERSENFCVIICPRRPPALCGKEQLKCQPQMYLILKANVRSSWGQVRRGIWILRPENILKRPPLKVHIQIASWKARVARFFLTQYTKTGENIPNWQRPPLKVHRQIAS
jgi:hypothetical protein